MADAGELAGYMPRYSLGLLTSWSFFLPYSGFFKGTSADQDRRFSDKELKLLKSMKFPQTFDKKVRANVCSTVVLTALTRFLIAG
jgi:hypothetical protein